LEAETV
jgi:hypothetical protein